MFGDGPLTFQEFIKREPVPLARAHDALLQFLRSRTDAVLCGAQAVNAYVKVAAWRELVAQNIEPEDDEDRFFEVVDGQANRIS